MQRDTESQSSPSSIDPVSLLIVDDSPYVLKSLRMVLRTISGLEVSTASDGAQAVREVTKSPPDLVLMDVQMPHMNGFEATRRVKHRAPDTKVVMMSVHDHEAVRKASRASGADHFVTKDALHKSLLPRMKAFFPRLPVWT
jgi:DNA-binding NarL/FixJ family response regulator